MSIENIEGADKPKKKPDKKKPVKSSLNTCLVLRSFKLDDGPIIRAAKKNDQGQYILDSEGVKTPNVIELNDDDMKAAMKLKAVQLV